MTKRKETKEKSSAAFSALPKVTVSGEGIGRLGNLGNLGNLGKLGKLEELEGIIGYVVIVPNGANVENLLSGEGL